MNQMRQQFSRLSTSFRQRLLPITAGALIVLGSVSFSYFLTDQTHPPQPSAYTQQPLSSLNAKAAAAKPDTSTTASTPPSLGPADPVSITIPVINVNSQLIKVGLNPDRTPQVPEGNQMDMAAWLTASASPGTAGTAVMIGHVDTVRSGPSVFFNLGKLQPGQTVEVARSDGKTAVFTISNVKSFDKDSFPSQEVYGSTGRPELRLITCGGNWDAATKEYSANTVVFASLSSVK